MESAPAGGDVAEVARLYIEKHAKRQQASFQGDQRKIERDLLKDIRRREIIDLLENVPTARETAAGSRGGPRRTGSCALLAG